MGFGSAGKLPADVCGSVCRTCTLRLQYNKRAHSTQAALRDRRPYSYTMCGGSRISILSIDVAPVAVSPTRTAGLHTLPTHGRRLDKFKGPTGDRPQLLPRAENNMGHARPAHVSLGRVGTLPANYVGTAFDNYVGTAQAYGYSCAWTACACGNLH